MRLETALAKYRDERARSVDLKDRLTKALAELGRAKGSERQQQHHFPSNPLHLGSVEGRRNSVSDSLSPFHRFEDWTAQHQTGKVPRTL